MLTSFIILAQQAAEGAAPGGLAGFLGNPILMLVLFVVVFWVIIIRPQRRAQKEHQSKLQSLKKADKVITAGGIHGTLEYIGDTTVNMKIADGVTIKVEKNSIVQVIRSQEEKNA